MCATLPPQKEEEAALLGVEQQTQSPKGGGGSTGPYWLLQSCAYPVSKYLGMGVSQHLLLVMLSTGEGAAGLELEISRMQNVCFP